MAKRVVIVQEPGCVAVGLVCVVIFGFVAKAINYAWPILLTLGVLYLLYALVRGYITLSGIGTALTGLAVAWVISRFR